ncbi:LOW QUALITY PROTEIN: hypothetical protein OSB04_016919 [Centaurea solstitialis]|uniref:Helitron helicase-like domain-containing protein n=1 Tax=Centaurea solstitialis TaxID=347529 RepID=A0AA38WK79_9ASTR|nr:LOW QUALITY PROTEIN: hypothetical protein OSB04_016919 [Centaurea solstitialis]
MDAFESSLPSPVDGNENNQNVLENCLAEDKDVDNNLPSKSVDIVSFVSSSLKSRKRSQDLINWKWDEVIDLDNHESKPNGDEEGDKEMVDTTDSTVTRPAKILRVTICFCGSVHHVGDAAADEPHGFDEYMNLVLDEAYEFGHISSYWDCGNVNHTCAHCQAMVWYEERTIKNLSPSNPQFSICCSQGKANLPFLQCPPQLLRRLLDYNGEQRSKVLRQNIKLLNAMTLYVRLNGHNHHGTWTLLPTHHDGPPRFEQLYIYDIDNRFYALHIGVPSTFNDIIIQSLVQDLIVMLDENNALVQAFRMAKERFNASSMQPVTLQLIGTQKKMEGNIIYQMLRIALIPGDGNPTNSRDVLIEERSSRSIKRYRLLFPHGEDRFHLNIPLTTTTRPSWTRKNVQFKGILLLSNNKGKTLHKAGHLFHTYVVDAYTAVLDHDLYRYKRNQNKVRSDLYNGLHDCIST